MFSAKYYDDPFNDDDNDICYAEVVSNSDAGGAAADADAFGSVLRRTSETAKSGCGASTEMPLSSVYGSRSGSGQAENQEYEAHIELLRAELKVANAENNRLLALQTKLESRVRSLSFEKENAERQLEQEKERTRVLADKVAALEEELDLMMERATSAAHRRGATPLEASSLHASRSSEGPRAAAQRHDPNTSMEQLVASGAPSGLSRSVELSRSTSRQAWSMDVNRSLHALEQLHRAQAAYATSHSGAHGQQGEPMMARALPPTERTTNEPQAAASPTTRRQMLRSQWRATAAHEAMVAQEQARNEQAAAVRQLETDLLQHSQQRDELTNQLERLERMRTRTVADRKKKAAIERQLENEEKVIGQIRLELRSRSALMR
ncbi:hypothetical protein, conserved [Leishmania tarentolae]|uniref:Uncharacterized protein n=1 Tax=Leishmania tarentolae TaxID=5689 RepID=A0A640KNY9_LEITA|nr:hypothetical protein, conserved [Leishmania tarentolae]